MAIIRLDSLYTSIQKGQYKADNGTIDENRRRLKVACGIADQHAEDLLKTGFCALTTKHSKAYR
jgi:hypothetical protein